jgi:cytoskeletal protein CcmA (bactofilin family)
MKHSFMLLTLLVSIALTASTAYAAEFRGGETVTIPASQTVNDDIYIGTETATIDGTINGDLVVAGGQIRINGTVTGDLIVAGGQITIAGTIGDDVRAAGGQIMVNGKIADDLIVAGGNVEISKDGSVTGLTKAYSGQLTVAGKTGSIDGGIGKLDIASTAVIDGEVSYMSDTDATIHNGASVSGKVNRTPIPRKDSSTEAKSKTILLSIVMGTLLAFLLSWLFPNKSASVAKMLRTKPGWSLLWGFLFLIVVPIAAIILLVTIILSPIGLGLLLLYPIFLGLGNLAAIIGIGSWLEFLGRKKESQHPSILAVLLGSLALVLIALIPNIGPIISFIAFLMGLGALIHYDWNLLTHLRADKKV